MIAVTTSDDKSWKMWTIPDGQMIMRGDGHTDWVSSSDFHPRQDKKKRLENSLVRRLEEILILFYFFVSKIAARFWQRAVATRRLKFGTSKNRVARTRSPNIFKRCGA